MPLDPQCQVILDAANAAGGGPFAAPDVEQQRRLYLASTDLYRTPSPPLAAVRDGHLPGRAGDVPLRLYVPEGEGPFPGLVFLHGGGWVLGDLETHDHVCRDLAAQAGCVVASIHYRLAPEHRFPAALDDSVDAFGWMVEEAAALGVDPARIAIGGDSAGGNLAAAACLVLRDRGGPVPLAQLLIYPAVDFRADTPSMHRLAEGYLLTRPAIVEFGAHYLGEGGDVTDPGASPLLAGDHAGLPPAFVQTAEYDPLGDEGRLYHEALSAAGTDSRHQDYAGMLHGFIRMGARVDKAGEAIADAAAFLRDRFASR